jgi:hypothetical protein
VVRVGTRALRNVLSPAVAATIVSLGLWVAPAGAAPAPPIDGTGSATCNLIGKMAVKPALITGGTATSVSVKITSKLTGCTPDVETRIIGGSLTATGTWPTNDCDSVAATGLPTMQWTVKWRVAKGSQKLNPSVFTTSISGTLIDTLSDNMQVIAVTAAPNVSGSFRADAPLFDATPTMTPEQFTPARQGKGVTSPKWDLGLLSQSSFVS